MQGDNIGYAFVFGWLYYIIERDQTEEWKSWLKTQHQKSKIMESNPIMSWQIEGKKVEAVTDFIFLNSKITVDNNCSHEIKRHFIPWKESYDKPRHSIKKQR